MSDSPSSPPTRSDQRQRGRPARPTGDRVIRALLAFAVILLAVIVAQPHLDRLIYGTPRTIDARGSLADGERTGVEIFERVSPSVVQVAARPVATEDKRPAETGRSSEKSSRTDEDQPAETGDLQA
ncbi:MAG: hypothetical protein JO289_07675, partial [Xanthobacteraceae bacterium]|nr:hypothetical protein [Xanthobacteraceae bacterium]